MSSTVGDGVLDEGAKASVPDADELLEARRAGEAIVANITTVVTGHHEAARTALTVVVAGGHLLIEDIPGVGKTMLAKALARSVDATVNRIQFTPDLLPSDVTGVSIYDRAGGEFRFQPGSVFANIVLGDEINRASPKTQSALLECMEERQVSVDGITRPLPEPFLVIATQNPIEMEGTYPLPEAQRDRFMARLTLGYPDEDAERRMLRSRHDTEPLDRLTPVVSAERLVALTALARRVHVSAAVEDYVLGLVRATREHPDLRLGASPRAGLQLVHAAKARAVLAGRDHVLPDDVDALLLPVLGHRVVPSGGALGSRRDVAAAARDVLAALADSTPVPVGSPGGP